MKMVTAERGIASIGSGGGYGHLRLIPLGNDVFLATAGGMYGNVFFYGLVIVPQEEHYLRRACEGERQAAADGLGEARRRRLLGRAQELNAEADALVALRRISALLADPADTLDPLERVRLSRQALGLADVLRGAPAGDPPTEPGCARYQTWYPRAYEKVFASQIVATR
jgi:hypothetical protein